MPTMCWEAKLAVEFYDAISSSFSTRNRAVGQLLSIIVIAGFSLVLPLARVIDVLLCCTRESRLLVKSS